MEGGVGERDVAMVGAMVVGGWSLVVKESQQSTVNGQQSTPRVPYPRPLNSVGRSLQALKPYAYVPR